MTILAAVSWSGQSSAPLNLAAQISRNTGDKISATAIVERPWPPKNDPGEDEYLGYVSRKAQQSLEQLVSMLPADPDISVVVHQSTSIPTGLTDLAAAQQADLVVVGSSSAGLLGRVALGSVTDRLVHTAVVPVALAPRGYPLSVDPVRRLTAAYGGQADVVASSPPVPNWPRSGRCDCESPPSRCGRRRCSAVRSSRPLRTLSLNSGRAGRSTRSPSS